MRFVRFSHEGKIAYGIHSGKGVEEINSTPFLPYEKTGVSRSFEDLRLLAPCLPSKVVAIGVNYKAHAAEMGRELPDSPMIFFKPSTSVIGPGEKIVRPPLCEQLGYEGELAIVIGKVGRKVPAGSSGRVILGYTCAVDATARDFQESDLQWGRAKGFDTSAPLGPWIETDLDPSDTKLTTRINGEVKQESSTADMVFDVDAIVEFVSAYITLLPGDVILTGTPPGVGHLDDGDRVEVEIDGIGLLEVSVKEPD